MNDSTISPSSVESLALGQALSVTSDSVLPDDGVSLKQCSKCGEWRALTEFRKGHVCRICRNAWQRENIKKRKLAGKQVGHTKEWWAEYRKQNREKINSSKLEYYRRNKDKQKAYKEKYKADNEEKIAESNARYYRENKEKCYKANKKWVAENKAEIAAKKKTRLDTDAQFKLTNLLRTRLCNALRHNLKTGSAVRDLGCSVAELKEYLESKFLPGMTWENNTYRGWHIDHIRPLASFDLTDREQLKQACHYTNLQPLWAEDNLRKGDMPPEEWEQSQ